MMMKIINQHPKQQIAIRTTDDSFTYEELIFNIEQFSQWLKNHKIQSVALRCGNQAEWVFIDLACQKANIVFTPVPPFFSEFQIDELISSVRPDVVISNEQLSFYTEIQSPFSSLSAYIVALERPRKLPKGTTKVTFTSGTTGQPKGVCLSSENQVNVAHAIVEAVDIQSPIHLCLLSLSTLLENVAGIYAPLIAGGTVWLLDSEELGFDGAELFNIDSFLSAISRVQPQSLILVPELLQVLIIGLSKGWTAPAELEFIAVGGSRVSETLILQARALGLPVYQGYGLSECGSVVSINKRNHKVAHSCGQVLSHVSVAIVDEELVVEGNVFLGYINDENTWYPTKVNTGDIAKLTNDTIEIIGRKKNIIINSYGRNISPEWIESEIMSLGFFQQAVVLGDDKPFCIAILVPLNRNMPERDIDQVMAQVNKGLPGYAQVKYQVNLQSAMNVEDGLFTTNGRPKRHAIEKRFQKEISTIYKQSKANLELS
ncbi:AMP-binding protein [Cognaticolwellia mytili]|uniref:AMP-binding protein n=1 Tax=Cognaticolwellia mytili TaxID=1888913 RepID=UPI000A1717A6|nr:AMP-binding protein [Cognaticolwellia mytili]